jgi:hypothetical protein
MSSQPVMAQEAKRAACRPKSIEPAPRMAKKFERRNNLYFTGAIEL